MSKKYTIFQAMQLEAMSGLLNQSDAYFYRKVCRWYSEKFHTPLHIVLEGDKITWDEVLLHYYETQFEEIGYNHTYELACEEYVPELVDQREQDNEDFAKALEAEQLQTLENKQKKTSNKLLKNQEKLDEMSNKILKDKKDGDQPKPPAPIRLNFDE